MPSKFVPLEEAAALLGVPTEKLVQMRSDGSIRGFKDGASWKFPQDEIDRLQAEGFGDEYEEYSGFGVSEDEDGSTILSGEQGRSSGSNIIGGDAGGSEINEDSDLELDVAPSQVDSNELVTDSSAALLDSLDSIEESAADRISLSMADDSLSEMELGTSGHSPVDDDDVDLSIDLSLAGDSPSDGGDIDLSLSEPALSDSHEINLSMPEPSTGGSDLDLDFEKDSDALDGSGLRMDDSAIHPPQISLGTDSDAEDASDLNPLGLMDDSDEDIDLSDASGREPSGRRSGNDVLSELDLLGAEQGGSGLIRGDSGDSLLGGDADLQSPLSNLSDIDDALDNDDDLVISDDDDDLVIGGAGSDVSVMDDSGINLVSPSDSGLSLESEPLDLAGSSISALDLGGDVAATPGSAPGSSGRAGGSSGSLVDFKADEEFQLSPSGIGLEADDDSASQVIEVEDSDAFGGVMNLDDGGFVDPSTGDGRGWAQRNELLADDAQGIDEAGIVADPIEEEPVATTAPRTKGGPVVVGHEVPFSIWNVASLAGILFMLGVGGMLGTDLIRNLWTYSETVSPISSLTETVLSALGMNG
ncbi:MAG: helix-turn-helix domain-containing protein [Pirellulaceae bacterium]